VGTKAVVLGRAAPPAVDDARALRFGTNAIFPVVGIGKAAPWPAEVGNVQFLQGFDHVISYTCRVGNSCISFAYIDSAVNTATQMLGKMAVNMPVDGVLALIGVNERSAARPPPAAVRC